MVKYCHQARVLHPEFNTQKVAALLYVCYCAVILLSTSAQSTHSLSHLLFYLQNLFNIYKQTSKSTVCINDDYATGYNTAVRSSVLQQQVREIPRKILTHYRKVFRIWTAKSSSGGFSVSFFWPDLKSQVQSKKKRKRRRRAKARMMVSTMIEPTDRLIPEPSKVSSEVTLTSGTTLAPNNATQEVGSVSPATCSSSLAHCYAKESCLKHHSDSEKEQQMDTCY